MAETDSIAQRQTPDDPAASWESELPVAALPADPSWRENFCFDGYDRNRNVGFWIHCGRWSLDPRIWREQVLLYWPDGHYLVHRAWGARPHERGVCGALLDLVCIQPGRQWQLRYRGPVRRCDAEELQRGALTEGPQLLLDLDVSFTSAVKIWDMTANMARQPWGKFHIEQTGRLLGRLSCEGLDVNMDGLGWHDHSRGPRDLKDMGRHCWIHGNLSRGRAFALTFIDNFIDGRFVRTLDKAVIWDQGSMFPASCLNPPFLDSSALPSSRFELTLQYERGSVAMQALARCCLPHSTSSQMECFDGVTPGIAQIVTYEQGCEFTSDGETHDGHCERSYRL
jgi:hypothetical protein